MSRLELVTECDHGNVDCELCDQDGTTGLHPKCEPCPGGSRISLDPDRVLFPAWKGESYTLRDTTVQHVLDALVTE